MAGSSDKACPASPLKFVKSSFKKAVESINKEDTKKLRSILARPTIENPRQKKRLRWAPDGVDPCTNKDEYWRKHLLAPNKMVQQDLSSEEKKNETTDKNSISEALKFVESSSVKSVEINIKEDSNKLRSILARPTGGKPREKKKLRWAPDVVDPCTNKDEYWRKFLIAPNEFVEQELSSSEEKKNET